MKVSFIFTDSPDVRSLPRHDIFEIKFEFPDAALALPDCADHVLAAAEIMGHFTKSCLHITCKELQLKNYPIKTVAAQDKPRIDSAYYSLILAFQASDSAIKPRI